jgi:tRNA pseudouridine38-40 synthase
VRNIRLIVQYDGTDYVGWQMQINGPSVQAEVTKALEKITGHKVTLHASGRTDSGVHAEGQSANFDTDSSVPLRAFVMGMNSLLPNDITVSRADEMALDFSSRCCAKGKTYRYLVFNKATPSALWRRQSWWVIKPLDLEMMSRAAAHLVGIHDFSAFRSARCDAAYAVRGIHSINVEKTGDLVEIRVQGTGFLRNMVRIIAGTLVEIGLGKLDEEAVKVALVTGDRELVGVTAPPQGLALVEVYYDEVPSESYP